MLSRIAHATNSVKRGCQIEWTVSSCAHSDAAAESNDSRRNRSSQFAHAATHHSTTTSVFASTEANAVVRSNDKQSRVRITRNSFRVSITLCLSPASLSMAFLLASHLSALRSAIKQPFHEQHEKAHKGLTRFTQLLSHHHHQPSNSLSAQRQTSTHAEQKQRSTVSDLPPFDTLPVDKVRRVNLQRLLNRLESQVQATPPESLSALLSHVTHLTSMHQLLQHQLSEAHPPVLTVDEFEQHEQRAAAILALIQPQQELLAERMSRRESVLLQRRQAASAASMKRLLDLPIERLPNAPPHSQAKQQSSPLAVQQPQSQSSLPRNNAVAASASSRTISDSAFDDIEVSEDQVEAPQTPRNNSTLDDSDEETATLRNNLFDRHTDTTDDESATPTAAQRGESQMQASELEQRALTEELHSLSSSLKQSALAINQALKSDAIVLDATDSHFESSLVRTRKENSRLKAWVAAGCGDTCQLIVGMTFLIISFIWMVAFIKFMPAPAYR